MIGSKHRAPQDRLPNRHSHQTRANAPNEDAAPESWSPRFISAKQQPPQPEYDKNSPRAGQRRGQAQRQVRLSQQRDRESNQINNQPLVTAELRRKEDRKFTVKNAQRVHPVQSLADLNPCRQFVESVETQHHNRNRQRRNDGS